MGDGILKIFWNLIRPTVHPNIKSKPFYVASANSQNWRLSIPPYKTEGEEEKVKLNFINVTNCIWLVRRCRRSRQRPRQFGQASMVEFDDLANSETERNRDDNPEDKQAQGTEIIKASQPSSCQ